MDQTPTAQPAGDAPGAGYTAVSGASGGLWVLARAFWTGPRRRFAWTITVALILLTVVQVTIPIALNLWSQRLFDALEQRDLRTVLAQVGVLLLIILANVTVMTVHLRLRRRLQIDWRAELTDRLLGEWMAGGRNDQLRLLPGRHDNPDGRIAEDIRIATESTVDLAHSLLYCILLLVSFTQILWLLSGPPGVAIGAWRIHLPGHLVWFALLYAGLGAALATLLGQPLMRAAKGRQEKEADFRFGLVRARETALTIALRAAERQQRRELGRLFGEALAAWQRQTRALANLFMFSSSWTVLNQAVPILVAAPRYVQGAITLGGLMQTAQAFQQMVTALSWPIDNMQKLAECRASIARVVHLHESLVELDAGTASARRIKVEAGDTPCLEIRGLDLDTPDGRPRLRQFDATVHAGERVAIAGDPMSALTLFRAIGGIWPWGRGLIRLPAGDAIFLLPRRQRLAGSTLRAVLEYPPMAQRATDTVLADALGRVGLGGWAARLDEAGVWPDRMSPAEQQRLGFARLLVHRPSWIFLREATSDLDPATASAMYALVDRALPDAAVVSISRDPALAPAGHRVIVLTPLSEAAAKDEPSAG